MSTELDKALDLVREHGYVAIKARSHQAAQTRQAVLRAQLESANERIRSVETWAIGLIDTERRLRDRVEFLYGVARARGASVPELAGSATVGEQIANAIERAAIGIPIGEDHTQVGVHQGMTLSASLAREVANLAQGDGQVAR